MSRPRPVWPARAVTKYPPYLPNRYSKHQTPASLLIDLHYARLGVRARWDWERYCRISTFLDYTPYELASLIHLTHAHVPAIEQNNKFPGPAALLLTLLEAQAMKDYSTDTIPNPFPHDFAQGPKA